MPTIPEATSAQINFFENHQDQWTANQASIGITAKDAADMDAATIAARNAFTAAHLARIASRDATIIMRIAVGEMERRGRGIVRLIRAFAIHSNNPSVYSLGGIPAPAPGSPLPVPPTPTDLTGQLNSNGFVELTWKSNIRGRMFFTIERQLVFLDQPADSWENRGAVPGTEYLDTAIPPGTIAVNYRVGARRGKHLSVFTDPIQVLLSTPASKFTAA